MCDRHRYGVSKRERVCMLALLMVCVSLERVYVRTIGKVMY